jgi:hypothetical protein
MATAACVTERFAPHEVSWRRASFDVYEREPAVARRIPRFAEWDCLSYAST